MNNGSNTIPVSSEENRRMNGQVEKVLQAALLDKHELNLKPEELDLHEVIEHAVDNVTLLVEEKQEQDNQETGGRQCPLYRRQCTWSM